jgi:hypothetical protein
MPLWLAKKLGLDVWENAPLPPVNDAFCGICLGERGDQPVLIELADAVRGQLLDRCAHPQSAPALSSGVA